MLKLRILFQCSIDLNGVEPFISAISFKKLPPCPPIAFRRKHAPSELFQLRISKVMASVRSVSPTVSESREDAFRSINNRYDRYISDTVYDDRVISESGEIVSGSREDKDSGSYYEGGNHVLGTKGVRHRHRSTRSSSRTECNILLLLLVRLHAIVLDHRGV